MDKGSLIKPNDRYTLQKTNKAQCAAEGDSHSTELNTKLNLHTYVLSRWSFITLVITLQIECSLSASLYYQWYHTRRNQDINVWNFGP